MKIFKWELVDGIIVFLMLYDFVHQGEETHYTFPCYRAIYDSNLRRFS